MPDPRAVPSTDPAYERPASVVSDLEREYPILFQKARDYDFAERLGGCTDPLMAEVDAAMRELWMARTARGGAR